MAGNFQNCFQHRKPLVRKSKMHPQPLKESWTTSFEEYGMNRSTQITWFSTSLQQDSNRLRQVFECLRYTNFKNKFDRSDFLKILLITEKIRPNHKFSINTTKQILEGFFGFPGYYRIFIKDFARMSKPHLNYPMLTTRLTKMQLSTLKVKGEYVKFLFNLSW